MNIYIFLTFVIANFSLINTDQIQTIHRVKNVDCQDPDLNKSCKCYLNEEESILSMTCYTYLTRLKKMPDFSVESVIIHIAYTNWPEASESFLKTIYLDLSLNQIMYMSDLLFYRNLIFLNMSYNHLMEISPEICKLIGLKVLDLSNNQLSVLNMQDFVCESYTDFFNASNNYLVSNLEALYIGGNRIKFIENFDLIFFGMPILRRLELNFNQIRIINVTDLSENSKNVINKIKSAIEAFNYSSVFSDIINYRKHFWYSFDNNKIESVFFNFELIYNTYMSFLSIEKNLMMKFSSISMDVNPIKCDCGLYKDYSFLVNGPFNYSLYNFNLSQTHTVQTICFFEKDTGINLYSLILEKNWEIISHFCAIPFTLQTIKPDLNKKAKPNSSSFLRKGYFWFYIKLLVFYICLYV